MKRLGNYLSLGLWLFALLWFVFALEVNMIHFTFTVILMGLLFAIITLWND